MRRGPDCISSAQPNGQLHRRERAKNHKPRRKARSSGVGPQIDRKGGAEHGQKGAETG